MCNACGMNHFDDDDIDYDDEELLASLGIDGSVDRINSSSTPNQQTNQSGQNSSPIFVGIEKPTNKLML